MIAVGYYTNEKYRLFAKELLIPSLDKHGITHDIVPEEDAGDWHKNTRLKVPFLMEMLKAKAPEPILYIDVDAEVKRDLTELSFQAHSGHTDLGVVYWQANHTILPELLTGTMFLRHTPAVIKLLEGWHNLNVIQPDVLEQKNLQDILEVPEHRELKGEITITRLEPEYCWIEPAMRHFRPDAKPFINHCQLSRHMWKKGGQGGKAK